MLEQIVDKSSKDAQSEKTLVGEALEFTPSERSIQISSQSPAYLVVRSLDGKSAGAMKVSVEEGYFSVANVGPGQIKQGYSLEELNPGTIVSGCPYLKIKKVDPLNETVTFTPDEELYPHRGVEMEDGRVVLLDVDHRYL